MHKQLTTDEDDDECFFASCSIASTASWNPRGIRCVGVNRSLLSSYDHRDSSATHALQDNVSSI